MKNVYFKINNTLCVIRAGKTSNEKISAKGETIVQTYHFSKGQFYAAINKADMREFFSHDADVCFDCPFAYSNGAKLSACYTHKGMQYLGFKSMLRGIAARTSWDAIPEINADIERDILQLCSGRFVRFGTYGEPSLLPIELTRTICAVAKNHTGYTHQHNKRPEFAPYFMASTHSEIEAAALPMWRSFISAENNINSAVSCPASAEMNYISNCSKCGLCSGTAGKGNKSVNILLH
jgi:hypothetical protein